MRCSKASLPLHAVFIYSAEYALLKPEAEKDCASKIFTKLIIKFSNKLNLNILLQILYHEVKSQIGLSRRKEDVARCRNGFVE